MRFHELGVAAKGALLSLHELNAPAQFGLRGAFGDAQREMATFVALTARVDGTMSAEILSPPRPFASRGLWVLDHGTDWILRVSPDAWEPAPGMPDLGDTGWLIAMDRDDAPSLLVPNQNNPYQLDLRTWMLRPFLGRAYVRATRWSIALTDPASNAVAWSLPVRAQISRPTQGAGVNSRSIRGVIR